MQPEDDLPERHEIRNPFHKAGFFRKRNDGVSPDVELLLPCRRILTKAFVDDSVEFQESEMIEKAIYNKGDRISS